MKKAILTVLAMLLLIVPAYTVESDPAIDQPIQQIEQEQNEELDQGHDEEQSKEQDDEELEEDDAQELTVVDSLEELQAAIDAADDGDTIIVNSQIRLKNQSVVSEKDIIIIRDNNLSDAIFYLMGNSELSGITIVDDGDRTVPVSIDDYKNDGPINIKNCRFIGGNSNAFLIKIFSGNIIIDGCDFKDSKGIALDISSMATVLVTNCEFNNNSTILQGAAINNSGKLTIENTTFSNNQASIGGGIYNSPDGNITIKDCKFDNNIATDKDGGNDILSIGTLTIADEISTDKLFYDELTGEQIDLPLSDYMGSVSLIYLTEEDAAVYFAPKLPDEETQQPELGDNGNGEDTPSEGPQEPGDQTEDDTTDEEQPPQEPVQPPEGEGTDDPTNNPENGDNDASQEPVQPPEDDVDDYPIDNPEQPAEPPQDDTSDDTADTIPDVPQQPEEPADSNNEDNSPPTDRPSQRPTRPSTEPAETDQPQEQPNDTPVPVEPKLVCNGAAIDVSRTVASFGYGNGLLHEDDPLTRAQLATIIYRLLDDESIALYSDAELTFTDVAADAWYSPYIAVLQAAEIVIGVGGGRYDPESVVSWAQIIMVLSRFVEPQECTLKHIQYNGWATQAIQTAVALDWIEDAVDFNPDAVISRGELVQLVNSVLELYRA